MLYENNYKLLFNYLIFIIMEAHFLIVGNYIFVTLNIDFFIFNNNFIPSFGVVYILFIFYCTYLHRRILVDIIVYFRF